LDNVYFWLYFWLNQLIGEKMFKNKNANINLINNNSEYFHTSQTDVLNIIKRNKIEEKQLKRKNIILGFTAASVLVIAGLLISL
tara:strand:+ start:141 stop:392 length:252 start_codon:yes stop_codon:yes gene_type:complete